MSYCNSLSIWVPVEKPSGGVDFVVNLLHPFWVDHFVTEEKSK